MEMNDTNVLRGDLRDLMRYLGRREAIAYAREFVARHRRIHQYIEERARVLAQQQTQQPQQPTQPQTPPVPSSPVSAASPPAPAAPQPQPREHQTVRAGRPLRTNLVIPHAVNDALGAIEFCRVRSLARRKTAVVPLFDHLVAEFPDLPRRLVARAVLDACGMREAKSLVLSWQAVAADGATVETVVRCPLTYASDRMVARVSDRAARDLLAERAKNLYVLSVDLEASVEAGNTRPIVHAVAWKSDAGGSYYSLVAPTPEEVTIIQDTGLSGTRVGLFGKFVRTPGELPILQKNGLPLSHIASQFRAALCPETFRLEALVGFNLAQDLRRLLGDSPVETSAVTVCDVMLSGPRKTPSGQWMRLTDMCAHFGVHSGAPHDARNDADVVLQLFRHIGSVSTGSCVCTSRTQHDSLCPYSVLVARQKS